jgi:hypothetical protein
MRRALILAAVLSAGAAGAFDASPLLQFVTAQSFTPLTLGPVAWWRMDDNAASTVVIDSAGANTGTSARNTSTVTTNGINRGALAFNGSSDFVAITNSPSVDITSAISVSCWVYPQSSSQNSGIVGKWNSGSQTDNAWLIYVGQNVANNKWGFTLQQSDNAIKSIAPATTFSATNWYHVVLVAGGTNFSAYVNGSNIGNTAYDGTIKSTARNVTIGKLRTQDALYSFNGIIDDVLIFPRALTQSEITQLYNWRQ